MASYPQLLALARRRISSWPVLIHIRIAASCQALRLRSLRSAKLLLPKLNCRVWGFGRPQRLLHPSTSRDGLFRLTAPSSNIQNPCTTSIGSSLGQRSPFRRLVPVSQHMGCLFGLLEACFLLRCEQTKSILRQALDHAHHHIHRRSCSCCRPRCPVLRR